MITKYVCMAPGCNFVSEDTTEAMDHYDEHEDDVNIGHMAIVSYTEDEGTSCETFQRP